VKIALIGFWQFLAVEVGNFQSLADEIELSRNRAM